jgi:hypothetical protein
VKVRVTIESHACAIWTIFARQMNVEVIKKVVELMMKQNLGVFSSNKTSGILSMVL